MSFKVVKVLEEIRTRKSVFEYHLRNNDDETVAIFCNKKLALRVCDLLNDKVEYDIPVNYGLLDANIRLKERIRELENG